MTAEKRRSSTSPRHSRSRYLSWFSTFSFHLNPCKFSNIFIYDQKFHLSFYHLQTSQFTVVLGLSELCLEVFFIHSLLTLFIFCQSIGFFFSIVLGKNKAQLFLSTWNTTTCSFGRYRFSCLYHKKILTNETTMCMNIIFSKGFSHQKKTHTHTFTQTAMRQVNKTQSYISESIWKMSDLVKERNRERDKEWKKGKFEIAMEYHKWEWMSTSKWKRVKLVQ